VRLHAGWLDLVDSPYGTASFWYTLLWQTRIGKVHDYDLLWSLLELETPSRSHVKRGIVFCAGRYAICGSCFEVDKEMGWVTWGGLSGVSSRGMGTAEDPLYRPETPLLAIQVGATICKAMFQTLSAKTKRSWNSKVLGKFRLIIKHCYGTTGKRPARNWDAS